MGIGTILIEDRKKERNVIKKFLQIFHMMYSEIAYQREPIPNACGQIGRKIGGELGERLLSIEQMNHDGIEFEICWRDEMKWYFQQTKLKSYIEQYILEFPFSIGFADEQMQLGAINCFVKELEEMKQQMDRKLVEQVKVIRSLSIGIGIVLTLILV